MECTIDEDLGVKWLKVKGRIDGMTCREIRRQMNDLIAQGHRIFIAQLEDVHYISSAGLRVFIEAHKQLGKVGGEVFLFGVTVAVMKVFEMSGFRTLFRAMSCREEVAAALRPSGFGPGVESTEIGGISIQHIQRDLPPADLKIVGSQEGLRASGYREADVVTLAANDIPYGFGLAALGDEYEEYKNLFGEALVLDRSLFFYPAAKHPVADFMLCTRNSPNPEYRFLNGARFSGPFHHVLSFESGEEAVDIPRLIQALFELSRGNILGLVLLAASKGFWGMNIRKSPISENRPHNGKDIFDRTNFPEWMSFPVEPGEFNHVIACAGVAVRDRAAAREEIAGLLTERGHFHLHGAVFPKGPLSKEVTRFEKELDRVMNELEVSKVQHVLGQTRFSSGLAGVVELRD
ncbi:MAG: STAS domain-containing protein [Thermodesulfobacteriota bacterium]